MVKASLNLSKLMNDPNISLTSNRFSDADLIIKRASFPAGEVPPHLQSFLLSSSDVPNEDGTRVVDGQELPAPAAAVKEARG